MGKGCRGIFRYRLLKRNVTKLLSFSSAGFVGGVSKLPVSMHDIYRDMIAHKGTLALREKGEKKECGERKIGDPFPILSPLFFPHPFINQVIPVSTGILF